MPERLCGEGPCAVLPQSGEWPACDTGGGYRRRCEMASVRAGTGARPVRRPAVTVERKGEEGRIAWGSSRTGRVIHFRDLGKAFLRDAPHHCHSR